MRRTIIAAMLQVDTLQGIVVIPFSMNVAFTAISYSG